MSPSAGCGHGPREEPVGQAAPFCLVRASHETPRIPAFPRPTPLPAVEQQQPLGHDLRNTPGGLFVSPGPPKGTHFSQAPPRTVATAGPVGSSRDGDAVVTVVSQETGGERSALGWAMATDRGAPTDCDRAARRPRRAASPGCGDQRTRGTWVPEGRGCPRDLGGGARHPAPWTAPPS
jgi:hypothetical protein